MFRDMNAIDLGAESLFRLFINLISVASNTCKTMQDKNISEVWNF